MTELLDIDPERIDWDKGGGLVPVIVQHPLDGRVLMLGYMNREALRCSLESGRVTFFSRTRQCLWQKGETSGHYLTLRSARLDCDADTLLIGALPEGPVCHTGSATCFGDQAVAAADGVAFLTELEAIISQRLADNPQGSYTAALFQSGMRRMAQKVGEEGLEVALAAVGGGGAEPLGEHELLGECADLIYHLLLLLRARELDLAQVVAVLRARHGSTISTAGSRRL